MIPTPVRFMGAPGSPYTRKMMAILRYRRIPYRFLIRDQASRMGMPQPKVSLMPTFYLPDDSGELEAVVDSTPLIRRFEEAFEERAVVPPGDALRFLDFLLEDYGDEWLTKAMFHYRWYYQADIDAAGKILPLWSNPGLDADQYGKARKMVAERQISRLYVVGSNDVTAPAIEDSYHRFLSLMDELIQRRRFIMGDRPGSADFAIYGQLTQLAGFDPTPSAITMNEAPRVTAWTEVLDDLSGFEVEGDEGWLEPGEIKQHLSGLLSEVGRVYVPALLANAKAIDAGEKNFETEIDGRPWQQPVFPYQAKCLQAIRIEFARLEESAQEAVREVLDGTGCEVLAG